MSEVGKSSWSPQQVRSEETDGPSWKQYSKLEGGGGGGTIFVRKNWSPGPSKSILKQLVLEIALALTYLHAG